MRRLASFGLLALAIGLIVMVRVNRRTDPTTPNCPQIGSQLAVSISDQGFTPRDLTAKLCDQVTFSNTGTLAHQVALGRHPDHLNYPGFEELIIQPGKQNRVILSVAGSYEMHDHFHDQLKGSLTVNQR